MEAFGCAIALDVVGIDMIRGFIGCGFCTSNTTVAEAIYGEPCSSCNVTLAKDDFIPSACDEFFRNLCIGIDRHRFDFSFLYEY